MRQPHHDMNIFRERRRRLLDAMGPAAFILPAHPEQIRNHDVHFPYRQDSHFYYLTGFEEPESALILIGGDRPRSLLFCREKNPLRETWDGFRYGPAKARELFNFDAAFPIEDFEKEGAALLKETPKIYYTLFANREFDERMKDLLLRIKQEQGRNQRGLPDIADSYGLLAEMRLRKTPEEAELLRRAAEISAQAHMDVMRATRPGVTERALHGVFLRSLLEQGAAREGYTGIFASGLNAITLHYVFNDQILKDGDLLLVDAGAEFEYYTGDITRTYPVNGRFSPPQKRLYEKVLHLQRHLVAQVRPGVAHRMLQEQAIAGLVEIMLSEGLLSGDPRKIIETGEYKTFYPHGVSHWLGMDVHDSGSYETNGQPRVLEPGMCLTIEPGLYVPPQAPSVPDDLKGIGIRIEDDVLVTATGHEVLSRAAPKDVEALEALIGKSGSS